MKHSFLFAWFLPAFVLFGNRCDPLHSVPSPVPPKTINLSKDTVSWNTPFSDTIRLDSMGNTHDIVFKFIDSAQGMALHDSIITWTPFDTGVAQFVVTACGNTGCDTIKALFHVVYGPTPARHFHFSRDTLAWSTPYFDTLHADSFGVSFFPPHIPAFHFIDSSRGMTLHDSIFSWIPDDSGRVEVRIVACGAIGRCDTIAEIFYINGKSNPNPANCPPYTHKEDVSRGSTFNLPAGYFLYAYDWLSPVTGLFMSKIGEFKPSIVPKTENDKPKDIAISDDGIWVLYSSNYTAYLIKRDGSVKSAVPTTGSVNMAAFWRNGPYGAEICYTGNDAAKAVIRAIRVTFDSVPHYGTDRVIADLTGKFRIEPWYPLGVSRDEVLGAFTLLYQDTVRLRMGFLTIPDHGKGIAGPDNMYKWKNDDNRQFWGCNSTLSHDGSLSLYIGGAIGFAGGYSNCLPPEHQGFIVTPFRRDADPAVGIDEHIDLYGISINWCPREYRYGLWDEMDFRGWYFGNRNDYVIGCQAGTLAPVKGIWLVDWQRNIWTMLTPADSVISAEQPAVFFSDSFAVIDNGDPRYRVVKPNGGERFAVSEPCTVKVASERDGMASIKISIDNGRYLFMLPGITHAINPRTDSLYIFTIPEYFFLEQYNPATGSVEEVPVSPVSDSCRICIQDYITTTPFGDCSDKFFRIVPNPAQLRKTLKYPNAN